MRMLIYTAFVSLDGVVDSPGGGTRSEAHRSGGWTYKDIEFLPEAYDLKARETEEATALMFGRTSYEAFSPLWPDMEDFAALKELPKYVVSTTLGQEALVDNWGDITILRSLEQMLRVVESEAYANGITKLVYDVVA
jgi:dihydrofolate reductase